MIQATWMPMMHKAPPVNANKEYWWWDGERVGRGYYGGYGVWSSGRPHGEVTHWAEIEIPEPPGRDRNGAV
jgi:hypothetical protein